MAITNHERVGKALELLKAGLGPFVEREFQKAFGARARDQAIQYVGEDRGEDRLLRNKPVAEWDAAALLKLMWRAWNNVFSRTLESAERTLVSEIRDNRNSWAHQEPFPPDKAYRTLDSIGLLLTAVSAPQAHEIEAMKRELLPLLVAEQECGKDAGGGVSTSSNALRTPKQGIPPVNAEANGASGQGRQTGSMLPPHPLPVPVRHTVQLKNLTRIKGADAADIGRVPKRFFQELIRELEEPDRFIRAIHRPPKNCIVIYRTPYPGARYGLTFGRGAHVRAEVFIDAGDQGKNKRLFDALLKDRQAVEAEFGEALRWERLDAGKGSRIALYRTGSIHDDDATLQEIKTWAIDRLVKFKKVFDPRLAQLRSLG